VAGRNLGGSRIISVAPGAEVIGNAPRIPAVRPEAHGSEGPQSRPGTIDPMAYDGDEGGFRRFSADLNGTDGRNGAIPAVRPGMAAGRRFSDDLGSSADNGGHIPPAK
jgi:hypothetical protein